MPGPDRLRYVADAFRAGMTLTEVQRASRIDPWFLAQIADLAGNVRSMAIRFTVVVFRAIADCGPTSGPAGARRSMSSFPAPDAGG